MMGRDVWLIQIFAAFSPRRVTKPAALSAALQAIAAFATTRATATEASRAAPDDGNKDEPAYGNYTNYWPPVYLLTTGGEAFKTAGRHTCRRSQPYNYPNC